MQWQKPGRILMTFKSLSLVAFALAVAGVFYLATKEYIFSTNIFTIIIQVLSAVLMIWARLTLGVRSFHAAADATKGDLVVNGPFRWIRHPIYASLIFFFAASLIAFPFTDVFIALLVIVADLFTRMLLEEKSLRKTYKEQYENYSGRTKRIIPFVF